MPSVSFPLAFAAGLLSFISPCVLPLVPVYLGYLSGTSLSTNAPPERWQVFSQSLFFVGGFTLVFVILFGLPTTVLAGALQQYSQLITRLGGVILILFGLHTMGVFTIPVLNITRQVQVGSGLEMGYARSALFGMTFAAGWTPCVGPLLGAVVTLGFTEPSRAIWFILVYAAGLAVPFLVTAALLTRAIGWLKRLNRHMRAVEIASGVLLVGVGILLMTGTFTTVNTYFIGITPQWLTQYL
ncbi:MAG: cytochrome c biogenesis protein CcdA [Anaerolineae bacterium]|nr:cytochrome c biogenesis protein CcdA [Anaerolineae bacterium]NIN97122.1 cytochrome c biogenesis protein CcdA [Anaerolineae bacterium]NIQ80095.1 cytochrome c biogenesis protein CcdA [Anaerolineae bacterium]